jgi:hypothetical protein
MQDPIPPWMGGVQHFSMHPPLEPIDRPIGKPKVTHGLLVSNEPDWLGLLGPDSATDETGGLNGLTGRLTVR